MGSQEQPPTNAGPPQAVVIIHGIGEQRPMATLRAFVSALLDRFDGDGRLVGAPGDRYYSKPDPISDSYELRRIKLHRTAPNGRYADALFLDWPETDFYEYYWAHQMYGTTVSHVVRWLLTTLRRSLEFFGTAGAAYPRIRRMAVLAWLAIAVASAAAARAAWLQPDALRLDAFLRPAGLLAVVLAFWRYGLRDYWQRGWLNVVGDAARYFDVNPTNVARRYDILRGGVALLRKLHEDRDVIGDQVKYRYGRIVIVGHSLGSVIAYDILRLYWGEVNGRIPIDSDAGELEEVEAFQGREQDAPAPGVAAYDNVPRYIDAQHNLWKTIRDRVPAEQPLSEWRLWRLRTSFRNETEAESERPADWRSNWKPARWLVSDLITLGSPLAHAPVLLAAGTADLDVKRKLRELPTCPPNRSRSVMPGRYIVDLSGEATRFDNYNILHHGACFALTRWTNLWYATDPVGGPISAAFGSGVRDKRLTPAPLWNAHVKYWSPLRTPRRLRWRRVLGKVFGSSSCRAPGVEIIADILRGNPTHAETATPIPDRED